MNSKTYLIDNPMIINPIICAIDTPNILEASTLTTSIKPYIGAIKLGLEFFTANGKAGVAEMAECGLPIFLDLKFHDIPNTVAGAIKSTSGLNILMMTVHTTGGSEMLKRAVEAAHDIAHANGSRPMIMGVTMLTSLDNQDLDDIGIKHNIDQQVLHLAELAEKSGLDGIVCSPQEIDLVHSQMGNTLKLVVPGIRPAGSKSDDQKRTLTPKEALNAGANYLVIGRPITAQNFPSYAAEAIHQSIV
jgi:orotidine-5'-phosphate decarboxylase